MQCKWRRKPGTDRKLYDGKIVVNLLCHFFFFFLVDNFNDAMIAALCSKSKRFNQWMAKWFHNSGSSTYTFLDDLQSQSVVCLNNGRRWKIAQKQVSLLVLQYKGILSEYRNHREAMTVAEALMFQWPLSIRDFHVSLHVVHVDYDVLLCESKVSKLIAVVIGIEGMASNRGNVHSLYSSLCGNGSITKQPFLFDI